MNEIMEKVYGPIDVEGELHKYKMCLFCVKSIYRILKKYEPDRLSSDTKRDIERLGDLAGNIAIDEAYFRSKYGEDDDVKR